MSLYEDCAAAIADNSPASTMVVLAVKPQMMEEALAAIGGLNNTNSPYLSIAAGISTGWLKQRISSDAGAACNAKYPAAVARALRHCSLMQILFVIWPVSCYWQWAM